MLKKLVEKNLFKKEDYVSTIASYVRRLTRLDIETKKLLDRLKSVPDSCEFDTVLGNIDQMNCELKNMKVFLDLYPSLREYIDETTEHIKSYEKTVMLLCYGAKFK